MAFIAYHKAISALGESLKDSELEGILHTSPTDLHKVATHVLEQVPMDSKSGHFLDVINNYSTVLDIISQGSPQFGCLIWGLLKFVLIVGCSTKNAQLHINVKSRCHRTTKCFYRKCLTCYSK